MHSCTEPAMSCRFNNYAVEIDRKNVCQDDKAKNSSLQININQRIKKINVF